MSDRLATKESTTTTNPIARVGQMVGNYLAKGTLHLSHDYSPDNALKAAWLLLQDVKTREGALALHACSQESVVNALLDMVVQGLNPMKKQCYFIAYGKSLVCQRSYFGDQALAERVRPGIEIYSSVVYEADGFEIAKVRGRTLIASHTTRLEHQHPDKIAGAYCGVVDSRTGEDLGAEIMTMDQIRKSWSMSKTYQPSGSKGTHHEFPDQMALRTVIRRRLKPIIAASSDALLMESIRRQDVEEIDAENEENADLYANRQLIEAPPIPPGDESKGGASRILLSAVQMQELTERLAAIPGASSASQFKASCERDGLDADRLFARLREIETDAEDDGA